MTAEIVHGLITLHSAHSAGVLLLNEIGLDPGIDHCSAHSLLSRLRSENKQVVSFTSFCGGLPAPEVAEGVPLGYKFSWSPRGVLRAASESASFRLTGQVTYLSTLPDFRQPNLIVHTFLAGLGNSGGEITASELPRCASFERFEARRPCQQG